MSAELALVRVEDWEDKQTAFAMATTSWLSGYHSFLLHRAAKTSPSLSFNARVGHMEVPRSATSPKSREV